MFKRSRGAPPRRSRIVAVALAPFLAIALLAPGCSGYKEPLGALDCRLEFRNLRDEARRDRVQRIISAHAIPGTLRTRNSSGGMICEFRVSEFSKLDEMHPKIAYEWQSTWFSRKRNRVFNRGTPSFAMAYETSDLAARVDTVVRFQITPGARLYYKPEGRPEIEITDRVNSRGDVALPVEIRPGQSWIYARSDLGGVERFIRINVYTGEMEEIRRREYPR